MVSAVWGHCEISMKYMGGMDREFIYSFQISFCIFVAEPDPLMDVCRKLIRRTIGKDRLHRVHELNLPPALIRYLMYQN